MAELTLTSEQWPATRILTTRLLRALDYLPDALRRQRMAAMASVMYTLLADHERQVDEHREAVRGALSEAEARDNIVAMIVGLLTAPMPALVQPR
jgi:hypothetical protein